MSHISLTYHIIWRTKRSQLTITEKYETELYKFIHGMCKNMDSYLYRINSLPDHVHICVEVSPKIALSTFMQVIKQESSKWMKEHEEWFPKFDYWGNGYGAFTYSAKERPMIIEYIKNQKEHHKSIDMKTEFNKYLEDFGLDPDDDLFFYDD